MSRPDVTRIPVLKYLHEVQQELQRVSWPTRQQTWEKTSLVILVSLIVGIYIGALDHVFTQVTQLLITR